MTLEKELAKVRKAFRAREKELEERVFSLKLEVKKAKELEPRFELRKAEFAKKYASLEEVLKGERERFKSEKYNAREMHAEETGRLMNRVECESWLGCCSMVGGEPVSQSDHLFHSQT